MTTTKMEVGKINLKKKLGSMIIIIIIIIIYT
jgi:hypothetical protein